MGNYPGGATSSRKRPYRQTKDEAGAYDNHALAGAKFYGSTASGDQDMDMEVGLPWDSGAIGNFTGGNVDGNAGFKAVDAGPGITINRTTKGRGDPTPGGGW